MKPQNKNSFGLLLLCGVCDVYTKVRFLQIRSSTRFKAILIRVQRSAKQRCGDEYKLAQEKCKGFWGGRNNSSIRIREEKSCTSLIQISFALSHLPRDRECGIKQRRAKASYSPTQAFALSEIKERLTNESIKCRHSCCELDGAITK